MSCYAVTKQSTLMEPKKQYRGSKTTILQPSCKTKRLTPPSMITSLIDNTAPVGNVASAISLLRGSLLPGTAQHGHVGTRQLPNSMTTLSLGPARLPASGVSVEGVTAPSFSEGAASLILIYAQALPMPFIDASANLTVRQSV